MAPKRKNQTHPVDAKQAGNIMRSVRFNAALAIFAMFIGLEAMVATSSAGPQLAEQTINRTLKGDRAAPAFSSQNRRPEIKNDRTRVIKPKLADGCESLVSPAADARLAQVAGRCVS